MCASPSDTFIHSGLLHRRHVSAAAAAAAAAPAATVRPSVRRKVT